MHTARGKSHFCSSGIFLQTRDSGAWRVCAGSRLGLMLCYMWLQYIYLTTTGEECRFWARDPIPLQPFRHRRDWSVVSEGQAGQRTPLLQGESGAQPYGPAAFAKRRSSLSEMRVTWAIVRRDSSARDRFAALTRSRRLIATRPAHLA